MTLFDRILHTNWFMNRDRWALDATDESRLRHGRAYVRAMYTYNFVVFFSQNDAVRCRMYVPRPSSWDH